MRTHGATEASVEQAIAERTIVRTWPLRGTLHFVAAEDVALDAAASRAADARAAGARFRQFELDHRVLSGARRRSSRRCEGGRQLSRPQLYAAARARRHPRPRGRGLHILWQLRARRPDLLRHAGGEAAHLRAVGRVGADGEAPRSRRSAGGAGAPLLHEPRSGDAAGLHVVVRTSGGGRAPRGRGGARSAPAPHTRTVAPRTSHRPSARTSHHAVLLPPYDEYTVAYKDRSAALDPKHAAAARNGIFSPTILIDGRIAGTWTRRLTKDAVDGRVETVRASDGRARSQRRGRRGALRPLPRPAARIV